MRVLLIILFLAMFLYHSANATNAIVELNTTYFVVDTTPLRSKPLDVLIQKYESTQALEGFHFLYDRQGQVVAKSNDSDSSCNPIVVKNQTKVSVEKLNSYLESSNNKEEIVIALEKWCENDRLLTVVINSQLNSENAVNFEEVISKMPQTKPLLQKYLTIKGQYWGSLSSSQICSLYFDVMLYLQKLGTKDRISFFKAYNTFCFDSLSK